jgi:hypothetical protein
MLDHDVVLREPRNRPISPASSVGSSVAGSTCDPLGRPLVFARLPGRTPTSRLLKSSPNDSLSLVLVVDDPDERRRSLGTRSASIDPLETFRFRYIETPSRASGGLSAADLKVAFIRVKEELERGVLNDNQYNLIIKQLIQVNTSRRVLECRGNQ